MRTFILPAILLLGGCQLGDTAEVGQQTSTITDGKASQDGAWPETVFLWLGGGACTATLIAPKVVLTAAHCVQGSSNPEVFFGNDPQNDEGAWFQAIDVRIHPSADIAVMAIDGLAPVKPTPIHKNLTAEHVNREVTIVGFGDSQGDQPRGTIKREGITWIDSLSQELMVVGAQGADTCFGDSGGPTFIEDDGVRYVAAVTSFGNSDDCRAGLSFNVRTDTYAPWIESFVTEHSCGVADGVCLNSCGQADPDCLPVGDACLEAGECQENLCATVEESSMCSQTCTSDDQCVEGWECLDSIACWPKTSGGGCSIDQDAPRGFVLLALFGLALLSTRRRRRCK